MVLAKAPRWLRAAARSETLDRPSGSSTASRLAIRCSRRDEHHGSVRMCSSNRRRRSGGRTPVGAGPAALGEERRRHVAHGADAWTWCPAARHPRTRGLAYLHDRPRHGFPACSTRRWTTSLSKPGLLGQGQRAGAQRSRVPSCVLCRTDQLRRRRASAGVGGVCSLARLDQRMVLPSMPTPTPATRAAFNPAKHQASATSTAELRGLASAAQASTSSPLLPSRRPVPHQLGDFARAIRHRAALLPQRCRKLSGAGNARRSRAAPSGSGSSAICRRAGRAGRYRSRCRRTPWRSSAARCGST